MKIEELPPLSLVVWCEDYIDCILVFETERERKAYQDGFGHGTNLYSGDGAATYTNEEMKLADESRIEACLAAWTGQCQKW